MNRSTSGTERFLLNFDYILFGVVMTLIIFGVMMISSATLGAIDPDLINRVPDQINYAVLGFIAMMAISAFDYRTLGGLSMWLYLIMMVLLLLVEFLGVEGDAGAQRWLNIGIRIQPSEIAKIILIITLSTFMASRYKDLDKLSTVFKALAHVGAPALLIFIQPNLGTTIVVVVIAFSILWGAGLRLKHIFSGLAILLLAAPIFITRLEPYQLSRITTFLNPAGDRDAQYNIDQALISVGSGGWLGKGYAQGSQNTGRFLRVRHTDFIFIVIAHEFGFVGAITIMAAMGLVIARVLRAARLASDPMGSMICYGVGGMIFFHTFVSIGMNLSLMPVTGLPLPFVSSGGTSLLFMMIGIGLVQSVVIRRRALA